MEQSILNLITHTVDGIEVKDLVWKPVDNIIRGLVKDPVINSSLHNGFVPVTWRRSGSLTIKYGGSTRKDLYLKL